MLRKLPFLAFARIVQVCIFACGLYWWTSDWRQVAFLCIYVSACILRKKFSFCKFLTSNLTGFWRSQMLIKKCCIFFQKNCFFTRTLVLAPGTSVKAFLGFALCIFLIVASFLVNEWCVRGVAYSHLVFGCRIFLQLQAAPYSLTTRHFSTWFSFVLFPPPPPHYHQWARAEPGWDFWFGFGTCFVVVVVSLLHWCDLFTMMMQSSSVQCILYHLHFRSSSGAAFSLYCRNWWISGVFQK